MQNNFLGIKFEPKIFIDIFLIEYFLWLENHFFENRFAQKIKLKKFLVEKLLWLQTKVPRNLV